MYVGHLAAGLLLKSRVREAPLPWLLFATVLSDLVCGVLLCVGVEHAVVHGSLVFGHIESQIGYSHSLLSTAGLAVLGGLLAQSLARSRRVGVAVGLAVLSHFVLDALSHLPDMPVIGFSAANDIRLGTGLAAQPLSFYVVECVLSIAACLSFDAKNRRLLLTMIVLLALYTNTVFGFAPPPTPPMPVFGIAMLVVFSVTPAILLWAARDTGAPDFRSGVQQPRPPR